MHLIVRQTFWIQKDYCQLGTSKIIEADNSSIAFFQCSLPSVNISCVGYKFTTV